MKSKKPAPAAPRIPFKRMTGSQKLVFILQVTVCIVTMGFVFPNVIGGADRIPG